VRAKKEREMCFGRPLIQNHETLNGDRSKLLAMHSCVGINEKIESYGKQ
jgi:hypothetical protein